jgi:hypothetical protein
MTFTDECLESYFKSLSPKLEAFARAQRSHLLNQGNRPDPYEYGLSFSQAQQIIIRLAQTAGLG